MVRGGVKFGAAAISTALLVSAVATVERSRPASAAVAAPQPGEVETAAGTGVVGFAGDSGLAVNARLSAPIGADFDGVGNLFIADSGNSRIRRVDAVTQQITTVAGSGGFAFGGDGGPATSARLNNPFGVSVAANGDIYIADSGNHRIRRVDAVTRVITTVAGTGAAAFNGDNRAATTASLSSPFMVDVDVDGNLYIGDSGNHRVRRVDAVTGLISTIAGTGVAGYNGDGRPATTATVNFPMGVRIVSSGVSRGDIVFADRENFRIRRIDAATGSISTIAGTGANGFAGDGGDATDAVIGQSFHLNTDADGNVVFGDRSNHRVRRVDMGTGIIGTVAGTGAAADNGDGGPAINAAFWFPYGPTVSKDGLLAITHNIVHRVRVVAPPRSPDPPSAVDAVAGDGRIDATWTAPSGPVSLYRARITPGGTTRIVTAPQTAVGFDGLTNGVEYTVSVEAFDGWSYGAAALSAPVVPQPDLTVPGVPTDVVATSGPGQIGLTWAAPTDGGAADSYEVEWHEIGDDLVVAEPAASSPFTVDVAGTGPHELRVRAVNAAGPGEWSEWATATPESANHQPQAVDDVYVVTDQIAPPSGGRLDIVAPGVLANDVDVDGDTLTVVNVTQPANGQLDVEADGSLVFEWDGTFCEPVEVRYNISDGAAGDFADITIEPAKPCLTVTAPTTTEGALGQLTPVVFEFTLSFDPDLPVIVHYLTVDGTATHDVDYVPTVSTIDVGSSASVEVLVIGEYDIEPNEHFLLDI
ncbi:MAG: Ig-like domain-containing protein, partial [Actinomycetota bacterium]|nr:Ig-like domain-containing protein [Actinomycetota bacterium]